MMGYLSNIEDELDEDDIELLAKVFRSQTFRSLLKVDRSVERILKNGPIPVLKSSFREAKQLHLQLKRKRKQSSLIAGLIDILEDPHIQALLAAHDLIADEKLVKRKADIDEEFLDRIKTVRIDKDPSEPLGATIRQHEFTDRIVIARILHGGAAQRTGLLHQQDEILEVNGIETNGVSLDGVVSLLGLHPNTVEFTVFSAEETIDAEEEMEKVFMRAHFSYNPLEDPHIPCKDAGLSFTKGDILEIIDINEPKWWQARKHGVKDGRTGIIPSRQTQEKRLALKLWSPSNSFSESSIRSLSPRDKNPSRCLSPTNKATKKKSKKIKYQATNDTHTEEIVIYEEVIQMMADFDRPRPIVITGVAALGCDDLRQSLVNIDPEKFISPIYYTTRSKRGHEQSDKDYHFVSRADMEKGIRSNDFINIEIVKNQLYGININSVKEIADNGKTCVMVLNPECISIICGADLHPFVVFIKVPDIDLLNGYLKSRQENFLFGQKVFTEEDLYRISIDSDDIENNYGHYFDLVLTISDIETTLNQLYHAVSKMTSEPLWVSVR